ncbi:MAG: hypothetical protein Alis3KO_18230 [Aliiglaciecola sp.]|uniref:TerB family tellurite resistance protein n=1 Tax=Aliiglaciecola sp. M165 TaxID=2593649 RepID=UPI0011805310|nr:TerB family tellurite resistance protein [Aliiglaciecola sp. M165]TRY30282.1 TerB family tellurite resistance protein [Aliiglaciecola sp. M165]
MRFDNFITALDCGQCKDQIQRQALFDIALMFVMIDGVIDKSEQIFMQQWMAKLDWKHELSIEEYYKLVEGKIQYAIDNDQVDDFLAHRTSLLSDPWMKSQATQLAEDISNADGELADQEKHALAFILERLQDKR